MRSKILSKGKLQIPASNRIIFGELKANAILHKDSQTCQFHASSNHFVSPKIECMLTCLWITLSRCHVLLTAAFSYPK